MSHTPERTALILETAAIRVQELIEPSASGWSLSLVAIRFPQLVAAMVPIVAAEMDSCSVEQQIACR